jgi:hypothetical protein
MPTAVTDELSDWSTIRDKYRGHKHLGLLIGNGASRAQWEHFGYDSLYQIACDPDRKYPLTPVDQALFSAMDDTVNFEAVLSSLLTTRMVCGTLNKEFGDVDERYDSIRRSLIEAVNSVHIPFDRIQPEQKRLLGNILAQYKYVYTTNYDLLVYWAMMETKDKWDWKDFFWGNSNSFDVLDSHEFDDDATRVFYLHGGLHLYHDEYGNTKKKDVFDEDNA